MVDSGEELLCLGQKFVYSSIYHSSIHPPIHLSIYYPTPFIHLPAQPFTHLSSETPHPTPTVCQPRLSAGGQRWVIKERLVWKVMWTP